MKVRRKCFTYKNEPRTEISSQRKITKSLGSKNAKGLYLSSRPTFLAFESSDSELKCESYD